MKNTLHRRLLAAFGAVIALVGLVGMTVGWYTLKTERDFQFLHDDTRGSGELLKANGALWQLRYNLAMAATADEAGLRKAAGEEAKLFKTVSDALDVYGALELSANEGRALAKVREALKLYQEHRPHWYELRLAGRDDEAKEYRAKNTTPTGAALAKAFNEQVDLQAQAAAETHRRLGAGASSVRLVVLGLCVVALGIAIWVAAWIVRVLTGPVARATAVANNIAQGHLSNEIPHDKGPMGNLMSALRDMQASLSHIVSVVRSNAEQVATAGTQIAQSNNDLSSRTENQTSALQQTSASMDQLGATVRQNADNAAQANQLAHGASNVAVKGGEVVAKVVDTMKGINDSSRKIADIIGVIDGIAFQTNILALNASVEAARAGEQGRGFAVVAGEVRTLAQRCAEAAKEIKSLINASVERVEQGTTLVDQAGATMNEVVASIRRVTDIVGEISVASAEQSAGVAQVGAAVTKMDETTQQNASLVQESAAASESLKDRAHRLVEAVAVFKLDLSESKPA